MLTDEEHPAREICRVSPARKCASLLLGGYYVYRGSGSSCLTLLLYQPNLCRIGHVGLMSLDEHRPLPGHPSKARRQAVSKRALPASPPPPLAVPADSYPREKTFHDLVGRGEGLW